MTKRLKMGFILMISCMLMCWGGDSALACVQGLDWGMTLDEVSTHLGSPLPLNNSQSRRFSTSDVLLDQLPVSLMTVEVDRSEGLRALAYEFSIEDMSEVLAGLRARHGQPLTTSQDDANSTAQIWVWNTGEDLITAVKRDTSNNQQFLISYRPSRLRPETL